MTLAVVKLCALEGCDKPVKGRGRLCSAHYERQRLYGDPLASPPDTRPWRGELCGECVSDEEIIEW